jgi:hypothetical protein
MTSGGRGCAVSMRMTFSCWMYPTAHPEVYRHCPGHGGAARRRCLRKPAFLTLQRHLQNILSYHKGLRVCKIHTPPDFVVRGVTTQRNPPEVRIWRLRNQLPVWDCSSFDFHPTMACGQRGPYILLGAPPAWPLVYGGRGRPHGGLSAGHARHGTLCSHTPDQPRVSRLTRQAGHDPVCECMLLLGGDTRTAGESWESV